MKHLKNNYQKNKQEMMDLIVEVQLSSLRFDKDNLTRKQRIRIYRIFLDLAEQWRPVGEE